MLEVNNSVFFLYLNAAHIHRLKAGNSIAAIWILTKFISITLSERATIINDSSVSQQIILFMSMGQIKYSWSVSMFCVLLATFYPLFCFCSSVALILFTFHSLYGVGHKCKSHENIWSTLTGKAHFNMMYKQSLNFTFPIWWCLHINFYLKQILIVINANHLSSCDNL